MNYRLSGVALGLMLLSPWTQAQIEYSAAYQKCLDSAQTTVSMRGCNGDELKVQDKRLNLAYKNAMAQLEAPQQGRLRDAQRLWVKYRDSNCDMYFQLTGGSIDALNGGSCVLRMTGERADELEGLQAP